MDDELPVPWNRDDAVSRKSTDGVYTISIPGRPRQWLSSSVAVDPEDWR